MSRRKKYSPNQYIILYNEVDGLCPHCNIQLIYEKADKLNKRVNLAHIYPHSPTKEEKELLKNVEKLSTDPEDIKNIIWLCPTCHEQFDKPRTLEGYNKVLSLKKELLKKREIQEEFNSYKIEDDIKQILQILANGNFKNYDIKLEYDPKTIDDKSDDTLQPLTLRKIKSNVNEFFHIIKREFQNLDAISANKAEKIAIQIKSFSLETKSKDDNQEYIFNYLVKWLHKKTNISEDASSIIISFFIQNCEVFNVISK